MKKVTLLYGLLSVFVWSQAQQISVTSGTITPTQLVQQYLISGCVDAFNVQYTGDPTGIGYFQSGTSSFDTIFSTGLILASGAVTNAVGPNNQSGVTSNLGASGDPHLDALIPQSTYDASVLEFDFIPASDTLEFNYVFGSDEYLEFVNSSYNDIFAFFLTGPNPSGGSYVNENIALIPGTTTPVSINNVNNVAYPQYYVNNGTGSNPNNEAVQYDGYTTALTAFALVTPCQTYHIKLAVADAGDSSLDSGVFLESGSFSSGTSVSLTNVSNVGTMNDLYEGCENYYIFARTDTFDLSFDVPIVLQYGGTATMGSDISSFPDTFWIPQGQIADTLFYQAFNDGIIEATETFIISIMAGCPCNPTPSSDTITIFDFTEFKAGISNTDSMFCGTVAPATYDIEAVCVSHPPEFVTYHWSNGGTTSTITVNTPPLGTHASYWVTIADLCGNYVIDTLTIGVSSFSGISLTTQDALCFAGCNGEVHITPTAGIGTLSYFWSDPSINSPFSGDYTNLCAGNYTVTVQDESLCQYFETFSIDQPTVQLDPNSGFVNGITTQYCSDPGTITLDTYTNLTDVIYTWNTGNTTGTVTLPTILGNTDYWVKISDVCGTYYSDTITISVSNFLGLDGFTDSATCYNSCDGSIIIQPLAGIPPFTFSYSGSYPPNNNGIQENVCQGNYVVNVIDVTGCGFDTAVVVEGPENLNYSEIITNTQFCGQSAPSSLLIETYVNTSGVTYNWNTGETTSDISITPVSGESYSVTITDLCGNTVVDDVTISISNFTGITFDYGNIKCNGECSGWASVAPVSGVSPFYYSWSPGNIGDTTLGDISDLCQGSYSVSVIDANGCYFDTVFAILEPEVMITEVNGIDASETECTGAATASVSGGVAPFAYRWSDPLEQTTYNAQNLCGGKYYVTISDINGCEKVDSVSIGGYVSVNKDILSNEVIVFPNPTESGDFIVSLEKPSQFIKEVKLLNSSGKVMLQRNQNANSKLIEIHSLKSGIYFLEIKLSNGFVTHRKIISIKD